MVMNCCNAQLFTRSDRSDSLVRGLLLPKSDAPGVTDLAEDLRSDGFTTSSRVHDDTQPTPTVASPVQDAPATVSVTKRSPFGLLGLS